MRSTQRRGRVIQHSPSRRRSKRQDKKKPYEDNRLTCIRKTQQNCLSTPSGKRPRKAASVPETQQTRRRDGRAHRTVPGGTADKDCTKRATVQLSRPNFIHLAKEATGKKCSTRKLHGKSPQTRRNLCLEEGHWMHSRRAAMHQHKEKSSATMKNLAFSRSIQGQM